MSKRSKERAARNLVKPPLRRGATIPTWQGERLETTKAFIIDNIVEGRSLKSLCRRRQITTFLDKRGNPTRVETLENQDMPAVSTVLGWLDTDPAFAKMYARAMQHRADALADEIVDIADDQTLDPNARRVMFDARKWTASKLRPMKYADHLDISSEHTEHINIVVTAGASLDARLQRLAQRTTAQDNLDAQKLIDVTPKSSKQSQPEKQNGRPDPSSR